ncbi:MAG: integration host factor subunit beta [Candidatus Marinimicrobia bacterium]|nr:integration host factor subunit beta [Candidatus Neomarinimicrobiota bacterium]MAV93735.1 integration host factor subunit beta [Candidatus Neomarinimicrobiota bacterium]|tara:strand:- start:17293 stop:17586 length:294 start_codon:yes stop_codon:yes gene_type:complete
MTKIEIIKKISIETGFTNVEVELFLDSFINSVKSSLSKGDRVDIRGFGSFVIKKRKARKARNPLTNQIVSLDERYIPFFKVSKILKEYVNKTIIRGF